MSDHTRACTRCATPISGSGKYCPPCRAIARAENNRAMQSPLRRAMDDGDHEAILATILDKCEVSELGCWEWQGGLTRNGYATQQVHNRTQIVVHRIALAAYLRLPLGEQVVHHTCANRACVNPEHLQLTTHRENVAEMRQRQAYLARIRALESALAEAVPDHPLLDVAPVACSSITVYPPTEP
ncbi:HNH endonuclease [Gordonia phage Twonlo]|nr:HNH endonuclease [Gordonia phage Twonlo]